METITIEQLVQRLQLCDRTIRRHIRLGLLPKPLRIGRQFRWLRSTIDDWIAAGCPPVKP
jgi:excisionase family DNA binding protein